MTDSISWENQVSLKSLNAAQGMEAQLSWTTYECDIQESDLTVSSVHTCV